MFKKNAYLTVALSIFSTCTSFAAKVEAHIQLQVGDRVGELTTIVDSEEYTQLSMDNESLGFAIKLVDTQDFTKIPTYNEKPIGCGQFIGPNMRIGAGLNFNGHIFEKELAIKILDVKQLP